MAERQYNANFIGSNNNYQPQQSGWFTVQIGNISDDISFSVVSVPLPEMGNEVIEVPFGNSKAKMAGTATVGSGTLTLRDFIKLDVEKQLLEWQKQAYDPETGKMGWVEDYKRDMTVTKYGPDGTHERIWKYIGVWISNSNFGQMEQGKSEEVQPSVTFEYDSAYRIQ